MAEEPLRRVQATRSLNVRQTGNKDAPIVAQLPNGALAIVAGQPNIHNYVQVIVEGWLDKDGKTVLIDSLAQDQHGVSVDAVVFQASCWRPMGAVDEFGRIPGAVRGWVFLGFTVPIEPKE